ncbi:MAG TPA: RraA family protein [Streptosporangiaceae bacterium]|nr:RraA family protein [Streptosporangiaceae bacterium]
MERLGRDQLDFARRFDELSTANLADGCMRAGVPVRCTHMSMRPIEAGGRLAGRVLPARHAGSVDIFLEAFSRAQAGDVLVVDNAGRVDEACVGDLVVLEAQAADLAGIVIWGLHRDTADIRAIGLPVFSLGSSPTGPASQRPRWPDALTRACVEDLTVTSDDVIFADDDGVIAVPAAHADEVISIARAIRETEAGQADLIKAGMSLRSQLRFDEYLRRREQNPELGFRDHLRTVGGAVEE